MGKRNDYFQRLLLVLVVVVYKEFVLPLLVEQVVHYRYAEQAVLYMQVDAVLYEQVLLQLLMQVPLLQLLHQQEPHHLHGIIIL